VSIARTFKAKLEKDGPMCFIVVPFDVKDVFGKARPPVLVTLGKLRKHTFASTVAVYGDKSYLPVRKSNREAAGLEGGETVSVTVTLDESERTVAVPKDLARAFARNKAARAAWDALSFSHKREHAEAIESAKKPETRASRVEKCLAMLSAAPRKTKKTKKTKKTQKTKKEAKAKA
jgi:hypothetical protein